MRHCPLDDFSSDLCRAVRQPLCAAARALLLDEAGTTSRGMGLLPHRVAHSPHHAEQCASAAAEHLPGAVVEGLRLFSRGHARGLLMVASMDSSVCGTGHAPGGVGAVAFWTVALTALYPIWFAQSSLATRTSLPRPAPSGIGLRAARSRPESTACGLWFSAAALCKERRLPSRSRWLS